jgi:acetyl-CoA carboxylase biotin carboxyl carrier protein
MAKKAKPEPGRDVKVRGVDFAEIERILEFMKAHGLEEFEYEREGVRVLLKKAPERPLGARGAISTSENVGAAALPAGSRAAHSGTSEAERASAEGKGRFEEQADVHVIRSPIVGTFYSSGSPGGDPFVAVGSKVEEQQVLCIIEAMKLMNEIESDVAGEVVRIFVENGHPVEYGEPLFAIRPESKK